MGMCQQRGERKQSAITSNQLGFTLLEVVIVVAIIGILAAVAVPAYQDYVRRGRIADAVAGLSPMQAKLEQYFLDNRTYVGACGAAGTLAAMPTATTNFTYTCPALTANTYTVTATGQGTMAGFIYSLSLAGGVVTKTTDGLAAGWTGAGGACWIFKRDGSC